MSASLAPLITSEIGPLEGVILHPPGPEIENMSPLEAERALYSDILNLGVATAEYAQLAGVLRRSAATRRPTVCATSCRRSTRPR